MVPPLGCQKNPCYICSISEPQISNAYNMADIQYLLFLKGNIYHIYIAYIYYIYYIYIYYIYIICICVYVLLADLISNATGTWRDLFRSSQVSGPWRRRACDSRDRDRSGERRAAVVDSERETSGGYSPGCALNNRYIYRCIIKISLNGYH